VRRWWRPRILSPLTAQLTLRLVGNRANFPISNLYESPICFLGLGLHAHPAAGGGSWPSTLLSSCPPTSDGDWAGLAFASFALPESAGQDKRTSVPALRSSWLVMHVQRDQLR